MRLAFMPLMSLCRPNSKQLKVVVHGNRMKLYRGQQKAGGEDLPEDENSDELE